MTITYLSTRQVISGASTDTKPVNVGEGAIFIEYDTGRQYVAGENGSIWTEIQTLLADVEVNAQGQLESTDRSTNEWLELIYRKLDAIHIGMATMGTAKYSEIE